MYNKALHADNEVSRMSERLRIDITTVFTTTIGLSSTKYICVLSRTLYTVHEPVL